MQLKRRKPEPTRITSAAEMRARIDELEEEVADLRTRLKAYTGAGLMIDSDVGLTPYEEKIASLLAVREIVTKDMIYDALYHDEEVDRTHKTVDVFIHKMRPKLRKFDIEIKNRPHRGWYVEGDGRMELRSLFGLE